MHKLSSLLALAAVAAQGVNAGSRFWESSLHYRAVDAPVEITMNHSGVDVTHFGTQSASEKDKRWVSIMHGGKFGPETERILSTHRWPDKKILFHYENTDAKDRLSAYLDAAKALWSASGLPDDFTYEEVESEAEYERRKGKILLIKYNNNNYLGTSLGLPTLDDDGPSPEMNLCDSDTIGTLNIVANFAHELGHAWGLHHEHQNPQFWTDPYTSTKGDRVQFGDGHGEFRCENLSDYESTLEKLHRRNGPNEGNAIMRLACRSRLKAMLHGFRGATEWLPLDTSEDFVGSSKPFDKLSIMIYPSRAGGKGQVTGPGAGDGRQLVLTGPGGEELGFNTAPSEQDVEGLKKLYGSKRKGFKSLLSESKNPNNSRFDKIRHDDEGTGC